MKVRVEYTVEVDDDYRAALNHRHGDTGLASREDVKDWLRLYGESMDADLMVEYDAALAEDEV